VISAIIAGIVLVIGIIVLLVTRRVAETDIARVAQAALITGETSIASADDPDATAALAAIEAVGVAMIDAGYSVETIEWVLADIARVNNFPESGIIAFPNALMVSAKGSGQHRTGAVPSGDGQLLFHQIDEVQRTVDAARTGVLDPPSIVERIHRMRDMTPNHHPAVRALAYAGLSGALAVLLGSSWVGVGIAALLGALTGSALLVSERLPRRYGALINVAVAFGVSIAVFALLRAGFGTGIVPALMAPLVVLLPGALLTTAALELSTGQMISGAGRLAAGAMQLLLLGAGIVTAAAVIGVPDFDLSQNPFTLGVVAPWFAVAVFGISISIYRCAAPSTILWIMLVVFMAYAIQVLADIVVGGVVSAFVGALVITPITALVARRPRGPAPPVSFTPAFWLLVPGAIGLVGVADLLEGDAAATSSLLVTLSTMVAIALGVLAGSAFSNRMQRPAL
jgi:uncharacterized membrane protein YjjP (DUF1212 family)